MLQAAVNDAMDANLATLLEVVADQARSRPAIIQGDTVRAWDGFDDRAARLAGHLAAHGIGFGTKVGVALYNGPEYLETVYALMKLRALPVNVNYRYQHGELRELVTDAGLEGLVFDHTLADRVALLRDCSMELVEVGGNYEPILAITPRLGRIERSGDDEWLLFTGGTTGRPKGVLSRHKGLLPAVLANGYALLGADLPAGRDALAATTRELLEHPRRPVTLVAAPLVHATGLYTALGALLAAGTVVLLPSRSFDAAEMARTIEQHRVTDLCIVGDAFALPFADHLDRTGADLRGLRRVISAGAVWSAEVKQRILRHCDAELHDVLAASESGPLGISVTTSDGDHPTGLFRPLPGVRVLDENSDDVVPGSGRVGCLAAPAPENVGYFGDRSGTERTFRVIGGVRYAMPGDLATVTEDGFVELLGRADRVINTGGEKVFAEEVERIVGAHPAVAGVTVFGLPDPRWQQRIAAVVALHEGVQVTPHAIREHVAKHLADHKRPREVVFVPELRRTPAGKPDLVWAREIALHALGESAR